MATKLEGGGKALVARPLVEELFFFAASLRSRGGGGTQTSVVRQLLVIFN